MRVYYDPRMSVDSGGYSPSARKPEQVVEDWVAQGLPLEVCGFSPATQAEIMTVHDADYVKGIFDGTEYNGHDNRCPEVANSFYWTVGSMLAAVEAAKVDGVACSPTSGFHHACYDSSGGFCTFNGLMVAAFCWLNHSDWGNVGIVDYDYHWGNGTQDIIDRLGIGDSVEQINAGDIEEDFLENIEFDLENLDASFILYQAGADQHIDDPLGGFLTTEQMRERDRIVFEYCKSEGIPVVWNLAGGYQREADGSIPEVLKIHRNTAEVACEAFGK